jgi:flagellar assembly protein FliH
MSCRARRVTDESAVEPFAWDEGERSGAPAYRRGTEDPRHAVAHVADAAAIERDAFAKGYAQGERAGADAAAVRSEAMLRRLAGTIEEIQGLRAEIVQKTERQVVQLALAISQRVINREISLDRDLLVAMARVALDRLADTPSATIRLHPEDYSAAMARQTPRQLGAGSVRMVADAAVTRGGCLVQSEFGLVDVSAAAQLHELAIALLGDEDSGALQPVTINVQR